MRIYDQDSSVSKQVERASNEGMVDVATPRVPSVVPESPTNADLDETKTTARQLLELQYVARKAYEGTLRSLEPGEDAEAIAAVAEQLEHSMNSVRAQLARLHALDKVDPPKIAEAIERVTGIAAGMFGEAHTAKGLMMGELAMAHTAEALIDRRAIFPSVRDALIGATVQASRDRAEALRTIAA